MERDEESGFNYHTARYYAPAFSRWTSADPSGTRDGLNVFAFVGGNPVCAHDRGGHQAASSTATPPKTSAEANQLAQERYFKGDMAGYRAYSKVGHDLALSEAMAIAHKTRDEGSTIANGALFVMLAPLAATIVATAAIEAGIVLTAAEAASAATAVARGLWIASRGYIVGLFTGFKLTYEALVRNGGVSMSNISQAINVAGANAQIRTTAEVGANVLLSGDNPIDPVHGTAVAIEKKAATALEGAVAQDVKAVTQEVKAVAQDAKAATQQAVQVMHAADVLIGTSTTQMRRDAAALIRNTPGHKLSFLLDAAGNLKSSYGMSHAELIMRPDIVQMGHLVSNKSGLTERIVLQGGWENQFNALTAEKPRLGTYVENVAIVIGEIGVELKTAQFWESIGWLAPGTVKNAPRITYMP
jgi:RHS repeat-associated protein